MRKSFGEDSTKDYFAAAPAIIVFVCLECLVAVQTLLAFQDHFLTVSQMRQGGIDQGLPFVWHFAMWGDLLIVSALAAYVIGRHSSSWDGRRMLVSFALGFASAALLSWTYTFSGMPNAHVHNHRLTATGIVHLFYMAIALAAFIQFFFLTEGISVRALRAVSLLLFVHVFVGTHMALGILNVISPLDWYPEQPLKSIVGWFTVATLAFGLIWRNVGTSAIVAAPKKTARYVFTVGKWLLNLRPRSAEGYIKTLDYFCGFVTFLWFAKLLVAGWRQGENTLSLVLILIIGLIYYLSRLSVKQELEIVKLVFPPYRIPDDLQFKDRILITLQVTLFMGLYLFMGWVAHNIMIVSLCMFVVGCVDFNTRRQINDKVRRYFSTARYDPVPDEPGYDAIQSARKEVSWFLFELPHLWKEAARIAGCAVAFGVAAYGYSNNNDRLNILAYGILIGTLVLNEIVTVRWRVIRDCRLKLR